MSRARVKVLVVDVRLRNGARYRITDIMFDSLCQARMHKLTSGTLARPLVSRGLVDHDFATTPNGRVVLGALMRSGVFA